MRHRFDRFILDEDTRQLLVGSREVHLSPKAFDLLALLLADRARAVSKAELQQKLWPDVFVEETNLAGLVVQIRRALEDSAENPEFIRTVYGYGYRFVGTVEPDRDQARAAASRERFSLAFLGREVLLLEGANVVGRSTDAAIQIDAPGISRRHAQIVVSGGKATLEDLGSKNGTRLNGRRIAARSTLADGDRIQLGAVDATFRIVTTSATETLTCGEL